MTLSIAIAGVAGRMGGALIRAASEARQEIDIVGGTEHAGSAALGADLSETRERFARAQPWPEAGTGEHIAGAALFLASDDSIFVTGEAIIVDGGLTAAGPELSRKFPRTSARNSRVSGITKGTTGAAPEIRRLTPKT